MKPSQSTQQEPDQAVDVEPDSAQVIFGDRVELARKYRESLATDGATRGFIGPREVSRLWERHLLNCAVVGEALPQGARVIDVGSGAGLPGIPLAIARPDLNITLIEPLLKRSTYLGEVVELLELTNVRVLRGRAEEGPVRREAGLADVVTSRAVAPLGKLAGWSLPLVHQGGRMIAMKGASVQEEIYRDAKVIRRADGGKITTRTCGEGKVAEPATVVVVPRLK